MTITPDNRTVAERLRQMQAEMQSEANLSLGTFLAQLNDLEGQVRDLATIDLYPPHVRESLNRIASAINANSPALANYLTPSKVEAA